MSLAVKVNIKPKNFKDIPKKMRKAVQANVKRALSRTAEVGIVTILERTEKGMGFEGGKFKAYSKKGSNDGYFGVRLRSGKGVLPNLDFTGQMMSSIRAKANNKRAVISFTRDVEQDKIKGNNRTRPFFGFSRAENKELGKKFTRFLDER